MVIGAGTDGLVICRQLSPFSSVPGASEPQCKAPLLSSLSHPRKEQSYVRKRWEDVRVGDFVRLQCNEIVPADILLLCSSDSSGLCHLETSNLDGETNLKQRRAVGHGTWQVRREEASVGNNHEGDAEGRDRVFEGLREETSPSPGKEVAAELRNAAHGGGEGERHCPIAETSGPGDPPAILCTSCPHPLSFLLESFLVLLCTQQEWIVCQLTHTHTSGGLIFLGN